MFDIVLSIVVSWLLILLLLLFFRGIASAIRGLIIMTIVIMSVIIATATLLTLKYESFEP